MVLFLENTVTGHNLAIFGLKVRKKQKTIENTYSCKFCKKAFLKKNSLKKNHRKVKKHA